MKELSLAGEKGEYANRPVSDHQRQKSCRSHARAQEFSGRDDSRIAGNIVGDDGRLLPHSLRCQSISAKPTLTGAQEILDGLQQFVPNPG